MRRSLVFFIIFIVVIIFIALSLLQAKSSSFIAPPTATPVVNIDETEEVELPITANFEIVTNGITRNFSNAMYKNQSDAAYIPEDDSSAVVVTQHNVTWADFFDTLPFSLDETCLITGDGDRLCNGEGGSLTFQLNGIYNSDALDSIINQGDILVVTYE